MAGKVLVFSPPGKPGEPKVEVAVLHLQPFADAPQVVFEEVPVGQEALRQLRVVNPSCSEQLVKLSGPLSQKGFASEHETFVVPAKQEQTVSFTWKPDGTEPASRVVLAVTSDKGFRGRCTLLGTVKPPPARPVLKAPKQLPAAKKLPAPKILTASQRLNAMRTAPSGTKPCPKAAPPPKLTVPKEFVTHSKKRLASSASGASSSKAVGITKASCVGRPCRKAAPTTKESQPRQPASEPEPVQETRRDTFDRDTAAVAAKENEEPPGDAATLELPKESTSEIVEGDCPPTPSNEQSEAATEREVQKTPA